MSSMEKIQEVQEKLNRVGKALRGEFNEDARLIAEQGLEIIDLLIRKNQDYGGSAWRVPILAPTLTPASALACRMSDKVERLQRLLGGSEAMVKTESIRDTKKDLAGYLILDLARPEEGEE